MHAIYLSKNDYQELSSYMNDNIKIKGTFLPIKTVKNCTIDCRQMLCTVQYNIVAQGLHVNVFCFLVL